MGKTAFLFSGQGAQRAGMGKEFYEHFASVRALFDAAEELRPGTLQQMFAGSDDELRQTENTQPCLYLADLAAAYALRDSGLQPEAVAGFSLGEIPALAFAGAYDGMTGFRLACARGASMARAGKNVNASMAARLIFRVVMPKVSHFSTAPTIRPRCRLSTSGTIRRACICRPSRRS